MVTVTGTFKIRRYWLDLDTPKEVLDTLNFRMGSYNDPDTNHRFWVQMPYVDINYYGNSDRNLTLMELKYADWIKYRQEIEYKVEGDDGLNWTDESTLND